MSLFAELKRRNVFRVGIAYLIAAWVLLQVTDTVGEILELPAWGGKLILLVLAVGFPMALIFAWAFEMTPEGLKREKDVDRSQSATVQTGRRLDRVIIGVLVLALAYFVLDKFALEPRRDGPTSASTELTAPPANIAPPVAQAPEPTAKPADQRKSIVVLPFINMSADPEQEYFSDGLSEELLNVLAKIKDLRVISRTSAFAFKGKDIAIPEIARQLDVAYVLEGSVRSAGDQVRITAQLIEVDSDSHLWSDAYNRKMENIFEVQEEISQAIAQQLQVELGAPAGADRPTENLEAYQLFLRGRHHYQARGPDNMKLAIDTLSAATRVDPEFNDAWANLAAAYGVMSFYATEGHEALYAQAQEAAHKAIELNPDNGFAHAVLGLLYSGDLDYEQAIAELELALELSPNESNVYLWMGIVLSELGYADRALAILQQAEPIDPVFANLHNWLNGAYVIVGDVARAREHAARVEELGFGLELNYPGELELLQGDIDAAETLVLRVMNDFTGGEQIIREVFATLRDPSRQAETIRIIQALETPDMWTGIFPYLYRIGAVTEAVDSWRQQRAAGRKLRTTNSLNTLWMPYDRPKLNHPAIQQLFEETGMADYWRKHGDPDFCTRQADDTFRCGSP